MAVHTYPLVDSIEHVVSGWPDAHCPCDPDVEFFDPETGEAYNEAHVIHRRLAESISIMDKPRHLLDRPE